MNMLSFDYLALILTTSLWFICAVILHEWGHFLWAKYVDKTFIKFQFRYFKHIPDAISIEGAGNRAMLLMGFLFSILSMPIFWLGYGGDWWIGFCILLAAASKDFERFIYYADTQREDRIDILDSLGVREA